MRQTRYWSQWESLQALAWLLSLQYNRILGEGLGTRLGGAMILQSLYPKVFLPLTHLIELSSKECHCCSIYSLVTPVHSV